MCSHLECCTPKYSTLHLIALLLSAFSVVVVSPLATAQAAGFGVAYHGWHHVFVKQTGKRAGAEDLYAFQKSVLTSAACPAKP